jgi:predicted transcriptional regulator
MGPHECSSQLQNLVRFCNLNYTFLWSCVKKDVNHNSFCICNFLENIRTPITAKGTKLLQSVIQISAICIIKSKVIRIKAWRLIGLWDVEVPTFSYIRLTDGGKFVRHRRLPVSTPRKIIFLFEAESIPLRNLKRIHLILESNRRLSGL